MEAEGRKNKMIANYDYEIEKRYHPENFSEDVECENEEDFTNENN